jgi:hypothetical protein
MHGICFDYPLQDWFDFTISKTTIPSNYISNCLQIEADFNIKPSAKIVWIGGNPSIENYTKSKKGTSWLMSKLTFHAKSQSFEISLENDKANWLIKNLNLVAVSTPKKSTFADLKSDYELHFEDFELFFYSKPIAKLRQFGLLVL